jgi:hypothetical protein
MTNESERAIESMSLQTKGQESSYRINLYSTRSLSIDHHSTLRYSGGCNSA